MTLQFEDLSDAIEKEIRRVSAKRDEVMRAARACGVIDRRRPVLYLMDQAMHFGRHARQQGDVGRMAIALSALKDIRE